MKAENTKIKVENEKEEVTGLPTPPPPPPPPPQGPEPRTFWTRQDAFCSNIFGPWNDLPCSDYLSQPALLRDLDRVIVLFEALIEHSDEGFRHWRERHKRAMESDLAEVPNFPELRILHNGKKVWQDHKWEQRYQYLIVQRQQLIVARLKSRFALKRQQMEDFFGREPAPQRQTLKRSSRVSHSRLLASLSCDWWQPLEVLLARAANDWHMDVNKVWAQFWREERAPRFTRAEKRKASEELVQIKREPPTPSTPKLSGKGEDVESFKKGLDAAAKCGDETKKDITSMLLPAHG